MREAYSTDQMLSKCCPRRLEICHDRWSCKNFAICVFLSRKHRTFLHDLDKSTKSTYHTKCDFALKLLKFEPFS